MEKLKGFRGRALRQIRPPRGQDHDGAVHMPERDDTILHGQPIGFRESVGNEQFGNQQLVPPETGIDAVVGLDEPLRIVGNPVPKRRLEHVRGNVLVVRRIHILRLRNRNLGNETEFSRFIPRDRTVDTDRRNVQPRKRRQAEPADESPVPRLHVDDFGRRGRG